MLDDEKAEARLREASSRVRNFAISLKATCRLRDAELVDVFEQYLSEIDPARNATLAARVTYCRRHLESLGHIVFDGRWVRPAAAAVVMGKTPNALYIALHRGKAPRHRKGPNGVEFDLFALSESFTAPPTRVRGSRRDGTQR